MLGGELFKGSSGLTKNPLGVVQIGFNGYDLGKTTADSMLTPDQDIKDILFQQEGTKFADQVRTGISYILKATFGEINTGLLLQMMSGITSDNYNPSSDSGTVGRELYESMIEKDAKALKVASVDSNGIPSDLLEDNFAFYTAIPIVNADLLVWGADTQRNLPIEFRIVFHKFASGESVGKVGAFGYWGDPTGEDLPAVVWPDVAAPFIVTADITLATEMLLTFNKVLTLVGGADLIEKFIANVDNNFNIPTTAVINAGPNDDEITLTFAAATFAAGNVVTLDMAAGGVEDSEAVQNIAASGIAVTNTLV